MVTENSHKTNYSILPTMEYTIHHTPGEPSLSSLLPSSQLASWPYLHALFLYCTLPHSCRRPCWDRRKTGFNFWEENNEDEIGISWASSISLLCPSGTNIYIASDAHELHACMCSLSVFLCSAGGPCMHHACTQS